MALNQSMIQPAWIKNLTQKIASRYTIQIFDTFKVKLISLPRNNFHLVATRKITIKMKLSLVYFSKEDIHIIQRQAH